MAPHAMALHAWHYLPWGYLLWHFDSCHATTPVSTTHVGTTLYIGTYVGTTSYVATYVGTTYHGATYISTTYCSATCHALSCTGRSSAGRRGEVWKGGRSISPSRHFACRTFALLGSVTVHQVGPHTARLTAVPQEESETVVGSPTNGKPHT